MIVESCAKNGDMTLGFAYLLQISAIGLLPSAVQVCEFLGLVHRYPVWRITGVLEVQSNF